jgi:hypothetical protein
MKNIIIIKQIDKANHLIVGGLIYCLFSFFVHPAVAIIVVSLFSLAKELWDVKRHRMIFDWPDFITTIVGALPIFLKDIL